MQELRQEVKDINSRPPQPEDPERSLDPNSEEDPDIAVELIDGVFHQLSKDNTLIAITADYPGLIPASQVIETGVLYSLKRDSILIYSGVSNDNRILQGRFPRREAEPAAASQQGAAGPRVGKINVVRTEILAQTYNAPSVSLALFCQGILTSVLFPGRRGLAGLYPERPPTAPLPARLQRLVRRRGRTPGLRRTLLQQRMRTGYLPQIQKWRAP